jgi:hypothetical protein
LILGSLSPVLRGDAAVAIVTGLAGRATVRAPGGEAREVRLFDWVPTGATVETATGSSLTLAFANGSRHELGASASVTLGSSGLARSSGPVKALTPIPPLPQIAPLASDAHPGARAAAVRIRGKRITGLYPRGEVSALPDETQLRFAPVPGAASYRVEVEDESGVVVFQAEVESPGVRVSPGVLKPGARYFWMVRTLRGSGSPARGEAEFATLRAEVIESRAKLRHALEKPDEAASLALLAEVDRELGLLAEAHDAFRAALDRTPDDAALRNALRQLEATLAESPSEP